MQTIIRKSLPQTVSNNRETYTYAPILSIVATAYKTPDSLIEWELQKEQQKGVKVISDGQSFYYTTHPAQEIDTMELTAD